MTSQPQHEAFEAQVLPHLPAARSLARRLARNDADAQDVVQDALLRALRYFHTQRGDSARAWLLQIVRNTYHSWRACNRPANVVPLEETEHEWRDLPSSSSCEPAAAAAANATALLIDRALRCLPPAYREAFVMREFDGLAYAEIARLTNVPVGTVMSRLARGRLLLRLRLAAPS